MHSVTTVTLSRDCEAIQIPAGNVTTMCFGSSDLQTLYITTARDGLGDGTLAEFPGTGSVFRLKTETRGLSEHLFAVGT